MPSLPEPKPLAATAGPFPEAGNDEKAPQQAGAESLNSNSEDLEGDHNHTKRHVFSDPKIADYWKNVYEQARYEGRHRFDPDYTWSPEEENKLRRKVCQLTTRCAWLYAECHG